MHNNLQVGKIPNRELVVDSINARSRAGGSCVPTCPLSIKSGEFSASTDCGDIFGQDGLTRALFINSGQASSMEETPSDIIANALESHLSEEWEVFPFNTGLLDLPEQAELEQKSVDMLAVTISLVMLLASDVHNIPEEYFVWAENYLNCIRNDKGKHPPNVQKLLNHITYAKRYKMNPSTIQGKKSTSESSKKCCAKPSSKSKGEPAKTPTDQSKKTPTDQPAKKSTDQYTKTPTDQSSKSSTDQPTKKSESKKKSAEQPTKRSGDKSKSTKIDENANNKPGIYAYIPPGEAYTTYTAEAGSQKEYDVLTKDKSSTTCNRRDCTDK